MTVTAENKLFLQETEIDLETLTPKLQAVAKNGYDEQIFVRADTNVPYGSVMQVMGALNQAGFHKIGLVTGSETEKKAEAELIMRWSLTTSILLHAAILASALVVLPNPDAFKVEPQDTIPVDIISIEDFSKRQATAKNVEPPKPEEKIAPKKQEVVKDVKPAPEIAPEIKTAAREPVAEPPEPELEEPKKEEPKPEEVKQPEPDLLKELIKETAETPEPKKEEPKKAETKKAEVRKPKAKPKARKEEAREEARYERDRGVPEQGRRYQDCAAEAHG